MLNLICCNCLFLHEILKAGGQFGHIAAKAAQSAKAGQVRSPCPTFRTTQSTKAAAPAWRSGRAMIAIASTHTYGGAALGRLLGRRPALAKAACWSVIAWECSFPLALVVPTTARLAILASGVAFHLSIAFMMRLNGFVWAFAATYAAIWWVAR